MLKILYGLLGILVVLYVAKIALLQLAVPEESADRADIEDPAYHQAERESEAIDAYDDSDWLAGVRAFRRGDDAKALLHLQACAKEGLAKAGCKNMLGEARLVGAGVDKNLTEAIRLFQEAAEDGDAEAQYNLGSLYAAMSDGAGDAQKREALAILNLYASSTAGHPGALMAMGYRHLYGLGVPKACPSAALNYIEVAKKIANIYAMGMPQAVELVRLNLPQKDRKVVSTSEMNLFVQIASSGDAAVAYAIGKRYLLGLEGFRQNYGKAKHYLRMAAQRDHGGALALLGYMYCLGLGVEKNLDTAYSHFVSASAQNDPLGHNGLGYLYWVGTTAQARNTRLAFKHFNESAAGGSSDGMFNLASLYLTGKGADHSFQKAVLWYTQALERGHTPSAYQLAVMHLNGIGTIRDCDIAVTLLKKVCERGGWVSSKLVDAYEFAEKRPDRAALLFFKLSEAGHEVAQMNLAHLLDSGQSTFLSPYEVSDESSSEQARRHSRIIAQRFYEMSSEQGSASSELRLGDFAYYGWGVSADYGESDWDESTSKEEEALPPAFMSTSPELRIESQDVDYDAAIARYRKAAEMTVTGEWMQGFVARGSFNLGFMHQFGMGVNQDLHLAKRHYHRCREVDPGGVHTPITMVLLLLGAHMYFLRFPQTSVLCERLFADIRIHALLISLVAIIALVVLRYKYSKPRRRTA